jgi:hypothetical protein
VPEFVNDYTLSIIPSRKKKGKLIIIFADGFVSRVSVADVCQAAFAGQAASSRQAVGIGNVFDINVLNLTGAS